MGNDTIQITEDEINAVTILSQQVASIHLQLTKGIAARKSVITLLEVKYQSVFDEKTGVFEKADAKCD